MIWRLKPNMKVFGSKQTAGAALNTRVVAFSETEVEIVERLGSRLRSTMVELAIGGRVSVDGVAQSITLIHRLSPFSPTILYLAYPGKPRDSLSLCSRQGSFLWFPGSAVASLIPHWWTDG